MPVRIRGCIPLCVLSTFIAVHAAAGSPAIGDVHVMPAFFNPSLQQVATLSFTLSSACETSVVVIDRDGVPIRRLLDHVRFAAGRYSVEWNGKDDAGEIVADEAWSFRIEARGGGRSATWFPALANAAPKMVEIAADSWDPFSGILRYTLPFPARVHIQAGSAVADPKTKRVDGPIFKTIVNREPRIAGAVIEQWDGLDESRTIRVTDLPHFVIGIAATPLSESSVITVGNRKTTFIASVGARRGKSLLPPFHGSHAHHQGLTALQDVSPPLHLDVHANGNDLDVTATALGPAADAFVAQHGALIAFVDGTRVRTVSPRSGNRLRFSIPVGSLQAGTHVLAINWGSPYGPVAVNAYRFTTTQVVSR